MVRLIDTPDIKVITGVRRIGKSKLLDLFMKYINGNIPNSNIIHINYYKKDYDNLLDGEKLYNYVSNKYKSNKEKLSTS